MQDSVLRMVRFGLRDIGISQKRSFGKKSKYLVSSSWIPYPVFSDENPLAFTRTLTIIYATSLLSILTHIQLNLTGRTKYIYSVLQMELRERMEEEFSIGSLFWSGLTDSIFRPSQEEKNEQLKRSELTEDTERK